MLIFLYNNVRKMVVFMGKYIKGIDRGQLVLFNNCIDDMVAQDNYVRVIDLFVEHLNLKELGFDKAEENSIGTDFYDPKDLLKLYLYGYRNGVRSSRKLQKLCEVNIEVMWLLRKVTPNFRTISEFRKKHVNQLKNVFKQTVLMCSDLNMLSGEYSQDGVKIEAVNSKEKNFTLNKIDEYINRLDKKITEYLSQMDEMDKRETKNELDNMISKEELKEKIEEKKKNLEKYENYRKDMERNNQSQKSLTDEDSRLMKNNGKFSVAYNNQVAVDTKTHVVVNYDVNNNPADVGTINKVSEEIKETTKEDIIINTTDKGYNDRQDMSKCLENGIIPQVTLPEGKQYYELEFEYEENEITEEELKSTKPEDVKKCLKAGKVPEVYKDYLEEVEIKEKTKTETIEEAEEYKETLTDEEMRDIALKEKCFVKNRETDRVYCPEGEILRRKSKKGDGIKYCNKLACKNCKNPCTSAKFKELVMRKDQFISSSNKKVKEKYNVEKSKPKKKRTKTKVVKMKLYVKEEIIKKRMSTSEHVHGTMKRTDTLSYFLLKGKEKVNGEIGLYYAASNIRRIVNVIGVEKLIEYYEQKVKKIIV